MNQGSPSAHRRCFVLRCPDTLYESVVEVDEHVILPLGDEPSQRNGKLAAQNST